jgi:hypothetical protein
MVRWRAAHPTAIAFGPPLQAAPGGPPQAFTARLQQASFALTRQAEEAPAPIAAP